MVAIDKRELGWLLITSWRYSARRHTYAPSMTLEILKKYKKYLRENDLLQIKEEAEWVINMRKGDNNLINDIDTPTLRKAIEFADSELKKYKR